MKLITLSRRHRLSFNIYRYISSEIWVRSETLILYLTMKSKRILLDTYVTSSSVYVFINRLENWTMIPKKKSRNTGPKNSNTTTISTKVSRKTNFTSYPCFRIHRETCILVTFVCTPLPIPSPDSIG